jgi:hypothetical protein
MLAILGSTVLLSFFFATSVLAQDTPHNEEYMQQHDVLQKVLIKSIAIIAQVLAWAPPEIFGYKGFQVIIL